MTINTTIIGNLTRDPELHYTPNGQAAAAITVAVNRRWQNRQTQQWEEATAFFDVVAWGSLAENVTASLAKGERVVVAGRLEQRSWDNPDGQRRSKVEIVAEEIGASLRWASAAITRNERRTPDPVAATTGDNGDGQPF